MMEHDSYGGRAIHKVYNQDFIIDKRFKVTKEIGHGAYGIVCSAKYIDENDQESSNVAIKKVTNIFSKKILCKRSLRELKLLEFFRGHKNITCLYDLDIVPNPMTGDFNEVYLYEELMECDMHQIIRSGQPLTDEHFQFFIYQTLCGLKYIHSADVLHRDLKPSNLLVNADCNVKICDFGLARGFSENPEQNAGFLTEYVATRWYRAPEIMLSFTNYTKAIDIWSVGCILAELLGGKPLFRGKDYVDQLNQILLVLGTPKESTLTKIGSVRAQNYVRSLPIMRKVPFSELFPNANPLALDLLEKMLTLDPHQRITTEEALKHPYLSIWRVPADEPECKVKFDFKSFESIDDVREMKEIIIDDVRRFRDFVRRPIEEQQQIKLQYELQSNEKQWHRDTGNKFSNGLDNVPSFQGVRSDLSSAAINPNSPFLPSQPNNETSGLINMDESNADFEHDIQYYQSIPKPQEIDEFSFFKRDDRGKESISSSNVLGLFQLEEELNFGLDGNNLYHNV